MMDRKRFVLKSSSPSNNINNSNTSNSNNSSDNSNSSNNSSNSTDGTGRYPAHLSEKARPFKGQYPLLPLRFPPFISCPSSTLIKAFVIIVVAFVGLVIIINYYYFVVVSRGVTGNGGWRLADSDAVRRFDTSMCNIERVSVTQLDPDLFEREYRYKRPVIVTFPNGARDWTNPEKWTVDSLKSSYGKWKITYGDPVEVTRLSGAGDVTSSLSDYLDRMMAEHGGTDVQYMSYLADSGFYVDSGLAKAFTPPAYFLNSLNRGYRGIFFLGSSGSGVGFHRHVDTWNAVAYGRKRWFMYPAMHTQPGGEPFNYPIQDWYERMYPNLTASQRPLECVQQAGELIYVPEGFYHAVINIGDTIAVTRQSTKASTEDEKLLEELAELEQNLDNSSLKANLKEIHRNMLDIKKKLKQLMPESTHFTMLLGKQYGMMGDAHSAVDMLQKAVDMDPYFTEAYIELGTNLNTLGRVEEAEAALTRAIELSPKTWISHMEYSYFLLKRGKYAEAIPGLRKAAELNPRLLGLLTTLKFAQEKIGDTEGARETQVKFDELNQGVKDESED